jgi:hypothetical protein
LLTFRYRRGLDGHDVVEGGSLLFDHFVVGDNRLGATDM